MLSWQTATSCNQLQSAASLAELRCRAGDADFHMFKVSAGCENTASGDMAFPYQLQLEAAGGGRERRVAARAAGVARRGGVRVRPPARPVQPAAAPAAPCARQRCVLASLGALLNLARSTCTHVRGGFARTAFLPAFLPEKKTVTSDRLGRDHRHPCQFLRLLGILTTSYTCFGRPPGGAGVDGVEGRPPLPHPGGGRRRAVLRRPVPQQPHQGEMSDCHWRRLGLVSAGASAAQSLVYIVCSTLRQGDVRAAHLLSSRCAAESAMLPDSRRSHGMSCATRPAGQAASAAGRAHGGQPTAEAKARSH